MTEVIDDARGLGVTGLTIPAELSEVFKDAKDFLASHSDKHAQLLNPEGMQESATASSAHAGKKLPTADNDAVRDVPTSSTSAQPTRKRRGRRKAQKESEIDVSPFFPIALRVLN